MAKELNLLEQVEKEWQETIVELAKKLESGAISQDKYDELHKSKKASYASKKVRARKDMALAEILDYIDANCKDQHILIVAKSLRPGARVVKVSGKALIIEAFNKQKVWHENDIFTKFKLGRTEMKRYLTSLIKDAEPEERMWIDFDVESGKYTLIHTGSDAPDNWTGYMPVTVKDMEITDEDDSVEVDADDVAIEEEDTEIE